MQEQISEEEAEELQKKLLESTFTFDDFLTQMQRVRKMGKVKDLLGMQPGVGAMMGPGVFALPAQAQEWSASELTAPRPVSWR